MKLLKTNEYLKKEAFMPSLGSVKDKTTTWLSQLGGSEAISQAFRGAGYGFKRLLHEFTNQDAMAVREFSDQLKKLFEREFDMARKDPDSEPGKLMFFIRDIHDKKGYRLTSNQQMITNNVNAFNNFTSILKEIINFTDSKGATRGGEKVISMIDATDSLGNPHEKRDRMNQTIIGLFANWLPKYYNDAVIIVTDYCRKNSCP